MRTRTILSILLLLTLPGCGGSKPTEEPASPTPPPSPMPPTPLPTPAQEPQPMIVTLKLWLPEELDPYGEGAGADILAQQLSNFSRAYPDLQVEVTVKKAHGEGNLIDFLRTARDAAPAILPDLVVLDVADLEATAGAGLIQPLDPFLPSAAMADRFPFATELGTVDEQTFGFVIGADMLHLAHRPVLSASPPVSWTQVISPPVSFLFPAGGHDRQVNDATLIQYLAAGGQVTDPDGNPWLDEDVLASVLNFYNDCSETGALSPMIVLDIASADQAWEQFQAGWGRITVVRANRYWTEADETVAAAPVPTRDGRPLSIARGWVVAMVTDDPARQESSSQLLDWLIAPERSAQWTQAAGYLPGTRDALRLWDVSGVDKAVLRSIMEAAVPPPRPEVMATIGPAIQQALEAVLRGQATPKRAADDAVKNLEQ